MPQPRLILLAIACLAGAGCFATAREQGPWRDDDSSRSVASAAIFAGDTQGATDAEIAAALAFAWDPASVQRLALFPTGWQGREMIGHQGELSEILAARCPGLTFVRVPPILVPDRPSGAQIRQLSARLQADHVLIFELHRKFDYTQRLFARDRADLAISLEWYLFDVRSGIIPRSGVIDEVFDAEKARGLHPMTFLDQEFGRSARVLVGRLAEELSKMKPPAPRP